MSAQVSSLIAAALSAGLVAICDRADKKNQPFVPTAAESLSKKALDDASDAPIARGEGVDERKLCAEIARLDKRTARAALRHLLVENCLTDGLVDVLYDQLRQMGETAAVLQPPSLQGASSKFSQQEELVSLTYGGISTFFKGLEGFLGMPSNNLMEGMRQEHTKGPDRETNFTVRTAPPPESLWACCLCTAPSPASPLTPQQGRAASAPHTNVRPLARDPPAPAAAHCHRRSTTTPSQRRTSSGASSPSQPPPAWARWGLRNGRATRG